MGSHDRRTLERAAGTYTGESYSGNHSMQPCAARCGSLVRKTNRSGLCQHCYQRRRHGSRVPDDMKPVLSSLELLDRADFAVRMLRRGDGDPAGLLAAVVWPTA